MRTYPRPFTLVLNSSVRVSDGHVSMTIIGDRWGNLVHKAQRLFEVFLTLPRSQSSPPFLQVESTTAVAPRQEVGSIALQTLQLQARWKTQGAGILTWENVVLQVSWLQAILGYKVGSEANW